MQKLNLRTPSRNEVEQPERLWKLLIEMHQVLNDLQRKQEELDGTMDKKFAGIRQEMQSRGTLISGVKEPAEALVRLGIDESATRKSNYSAAVAPNVGNDSTQGYDIGSEWIDRQTGNVYKCVAAEPGNAVWQQTN